MKQALRAKKKTTTLLFIPVVRCNLPESTSHTQSDELKEILLPAADSKSLDRISRRLSLYIVQSQR